MRCLEGLCHPAWVLRSLCTCPKGFTSPNSQSSECSLAGLETYLLALGMISDVAAEKSQSRRAPVFLITSSAPLPWGEAAEKATGKGELGDKNIPRASLLFTLSRGPVLC